MIFFFFGGMICLFYLHVDVRVAHLQIERGPKKVKERHNLKLILIMDFRILLES